MALATKVRPYAVILLDLSIARTGEAQNEIYIEGKIFTDWVANTITIISTGTGTLKIALTQGAHNITGSDGFKVEGVRFNNIYWTNVAQSDKTAEIFVAWVD